ncbi:MAG: 50S ribosomal protein L20 [Patescibacteria group bacterium]|jgi:large subunit ribosomal protein L20
MPRVKRGTAHVKRRKNLLARTKGYKWGRKKKIKEAKTAVLKAGAHAFRDRRAKKRTARSVWQIRINAAVREEGLTYSKFMDLLKKSKVEIDRKVLSELAQKNPEVFKAIVKLVQK